MVVTGTPEDGPNGVGTGRLDRRRQGYPRGRRRRAFRFRHRPHPARIQRRAAPRPDRHRRRCRHGQARGGAPGRAGGQNPGKNRTRPRRRRNQGIPLRLGRALRDGGPGQDHGAFRRRRQGAVIHGFRRMPEMMKVSAAGLMMSRLQIMPFKIPPSTPASLREYRGRCWWRDRGWNRGPRSWPSIR